MRYGNILCLIFVGFSILPFSQRVNPGYQFETPLDQCGWGTTLYGSGQKTQAKLFLEQGFEGMLQDQLGPLHPIEFGTCAVSLAEIRNKSGDWDAALDAYVIAANLFRMGDTDTSSATIFGGDDQMEWAALAGAGEVLITMGRLDEAREVLETGLQLVKNSTQPWNFPYIPGGQELAHLSTLNTLAILDVHAASQDSTQNYFAEAQMYLSEALDISEELRNLPAASVEPEALSGIPEDLNEQLKELIRQIEEMGIPTDTLQSDQNRFERSVADLALADAAADEVRDTFFQAIEATLWNSIGEVNRLQGRESDAREAYLQVVNLTAPLMELNGLTAATTLDYVTANRALAFNQLGRLHLDHGESDEALTFLLDGEVLARNFQFEPLLALILMNLGDAWLARGESEKAVNAFEEALDIVDALRFSTDQGVIRVTTTEVFPIETFVVSSTLQTFESAYAHIASIYHQLGSKEEAFYTTERGRARQFLNALATGQWQLGDVAKSSLLDKEQEGFLRIKTAEQQLNLAQMFIPDFAAIKSLRQELAAAKAAYEEILGEIEASGGQIASLIPGQSPLLQIPNVQALLDDKTTLLSYWVTESDTIVFVITANTFESVSLGINRKSLTEKVLAYRRFPNLEPSYPPAEILYGDLIAPLQARQLLTTPNLIVIPHNILHYLPFAGLFIVEESMLDDFRITYLPSVSTLLFFQGGENLVTCRPLIVGNPMIENSSGDFASLAMAEREAEAIGEMCEASTYTKNQATESLVRNRVSRANILHLAAHGVYDTKSPLDSAILLAPNSEHDGRLTAGEIYELDLQNVELVVLSACETQLGQINAGDEVIGLNRAFLFQSPSVIATLWTVNDLPTRLLMERLYTYLLDGHGPGDALRLAQKDIRAQFPNPYYWAGFVLSGNGGKIKEILPTQSPSTSAPEIIRLSTPTPMQSNPVESTLPRIRIPLVIFGIILLTSVVFLLYRSRHSLQ